MANDDQILTGENEALIIIQNLEEQEAAEVDNTFAPGWPGVPARWTSSNKNGVGTAINVASKVWFTISHGILNEIYYPQVDQACTRDMGLIVTDRKEFFSEEKRHTIHHTEILAEGVPAFKITNTCKDGNYRIEKEIITDPSRDSVLQKIQFFPLKNTIDDYNLHVLLTPHLGNYGSGNTAWVGDYKGMPMLFAERNDSALALACSVSFKNRSVGFVGDMDGWRDLKKHKQMTLNFQRAENGNVSVIAEIDLTDMEGKTFILALGFGRNSAEAGQRAKASIQEGFDEAKEKYTSEWMQWQKELPSIKSLKKDSRSLFRISAAVLRIHESKRHPGGFIASLSIPWGFSKGDDDLGGYHVVWPRDMAQTAGGLLAAKAGEDAKRVLNYLMVTQEEDGHWAQNMWLDGVPYWSGIQMDQTACPILLVDLASRENILDAVDLQKLWPMVKKAAGYLVAHGPATHQDRWEENSGYSTFTLAVEIAALLVAADFADLNEEHEIGLYLRETADIWNDSVERWTYVTDTQLANKVGVDGYYVRIAPIEMTEEPSAISDFIQIINRPLEDSIMSAKEIVSPDALALVRFGLRAADDPRILNTIKVIDETLKVETPFGPCWYRYNGDGYGEHADGKPFDGTGIGRAWPLLTGERAIYEIAAGRFDVAKKLLKTIESFANEGGMLPEQIWDKDDLPDSELYFGKASGSAMPLAWAHAEYIKVCRSLSEKEVFDMPPQTKKRYIEDKVISKFALWNFNNKCNFISKGKILRIETLHPACIRWTTDNWITTHDTTSRDTLLGVFVADLPTQDVPSGGKIFYTFYWPEAKNWEKIDFKIEVE